MELNQYLRYEHFAAGIRVYQIDDALILTLKGEPEYSFSANEATPENVLIEADKLLKRGNKNGK